MSTTVVAGAGVGGLALGLLLRRAGRPVIVCERAPRGRAGGALVLWSNAMRVLAELGLDDAVTAAGAPLEHAEFRSARGERLTSLPVGEVSRRHGAATVVVPRGALFDLLADAFEAAGEPVRWGNGCAGFAQDADGVTVALSDGAELRGDTLVGADGLHSTIREQLFGASPPRSAAQEVWVGIAAPGAGPLTPGIATATLGQGQRFWNAPLGGGRAYWYATVKREGQHGGAADKAELLERFRRWHAPIPDLIAATDEGDLLRTALRDREPVERWGADRVTLLGDAAHPSTPDLGQGACQALESASVLARILVEVRDMPAALRLYEARRRSRTGTVTRLSRAVALHSVPDEPLLSSARDLFLRTAFRPLALLQLEWLLAGSDAPFRER